MKIYLIYIPELDNPIEVKCSTDEEAWREAERIYNLDREPQDYEEADLSWTMVEVKKPEPELSWDFDSDQRDMVWTVRKD